MGDTDLRALLEAWDARRRARAEFDAALGHAPEEFPGGAPEYWAMAARLLACEAEVDVRMGALRRALGPVTPP